ncbi:MAG: alpha/beta fold hydrolase [Melioribacteraceae bacterium]|nr:alpha/beta fold hydrolase [Melioribacteraceae bacterium]
MKLNFDPITQDPPESNVDYPATVRTFTIDSHGSKLIGSILIASGEGPHPTIILFNGFPGNDTNSDIAHSMRRTGFNVVNFSYRGSWGSDGEYSWNNALEDSKVIINYFRLKEVEKLYRCDNEKIILVGHSMGGFVTLLNAATDDKIKQAASFAGFNFGLWAEMILGNDDIKNISLERMKDSVELLRGTSPQALLDEMVQHHKEWNLLNHAQTLSQKNLLLIAAKFDQLAPVELHHQPLIKLLKGSNTDLEDKIISTGHSFSDKRIELTRTIINWLNKIEF